MSDDLTHFDEEGRAVMVDVADKSISKRLATAAGTIRMQPATMQRILDNDIKKGDVLAVARLAGIMAAKQTPHLIPLCHPLLLASVSIDFEPDVDTGSLAIEATVGVTGQTGVEMEAMTAVSVTALTVYDMCKAIDRSMELGEIRLLDKQGGKSGHWQREPK